MNNNLILRVLNSPYNDVTRNSVLSQSDVDNNFIYLKGDLIYTATTSGDTTYLHKYNGETISFLGGSGGGSAVSITYNEFYNLITSNSLVVGTKYKITDYRSANFLNGIGVANNLPPQNQPEWDYD